MLENIWERIGHEVDSFTAEIRDVPVNPNVSPAEVRERLSRYTFDSPIGLDELTNEVVELLRSYTVHVTHPRYFGLFNPSVRIAGVVADTLTALYNPQLAVWSHAPFAVEMEQHTLHHLTRKLGFSPATTVANFTSGGAEANLSAVLSALAYHFPETSESGVAALSVKPAIYLTGESHHSFVKVARMTGLGTSALRQVQTDAHHLFSTVALRERIESDVRDGMTPLMIVGTAGTTGAGLIDPLPELSEIAKELGAWFHVDAAWGASALLSSKLRYVLAGIETADSVTWDAHKWLSVPMGAGMFFCRHREAVRSAFTLATSYMPDASGDDAIDPYTSTPQWSRRAIGLKVFMSLAEIGFAGYEGLIDHQAHLGNRLRELLATHEWQVTNETALPVVCFTHREIRDGLFTTSDLLEVLYERGKVWISDVVIGDRERVLRACITSFRSEESDLRCLIDEIEHARISLTS